MDAAIIRHHKIESSRVMRLILLLLIDAPFDEKESPPENFNRRKPQRLSCTGDPDRRQVKGIIPLAGGPVQDLALASPRIVNKKVGENSKRKTVNWVRKVLGFPCIFREWPEGGG